MNYIESLTDIKKRAAKIKTLIDKADTSRPHASRAIASATESLHRIQQEMVLLESTLEQFTSSSTPVKVGPSETKQGK